MPERFNRPYSAMPLPKNLQMLSGPLFLLHRVHNGIPQAIEVAQVLQEFVFFEFPERVLKKRPVGFDDVA